MNLSQSYVEVKYEATIFTTILNKSVQRRILQVSERPKFFTFTRVKYIHKHTIYWTIDDECRVRVERVRTSGRRYIEYILNFEILAVGILF